jgi:hypothetical protein
VGAALGRQIAAQVQATLGEWDGHDLFLEVNIEEPHRRYDQGGARPDRRHGVDIPRFLGDVCDEPGYRRACTSDMAALQGAVHQADAAIGAILDAIPRATGAETLVCFVVDHGLAMPGAKCTLYDSGVQTALLMCWPGGGLSGGRVVPDLLSNVDVPVTLLDAAGVEHPPGVEGRSFLERARGGAECAREWVLMEKTEHSYRDPMRALRTERWKLIWNLEPRPAIEVPGDVQETSPIFRFRPSLFTGGIHPPVELYDLARDPGERCNLAFSAGAAAVVDALTARLWERLVAEGDAVLTGPSTCPSHANRRELMMAAARRGRVWEKPLALLDVPASAHGRSSGRGTIGLC